MSKPKEFWINGGEVFYTEEDGRYMENALLKKTTHVIEKSAYDKLQAKADKLAEALEYATDIICSVRDQQDSKTMIWHYDEIIKELENVWERVRRADDQRQET